MLQLMKHAYTPFLVYNYVQITGHFVEMKFYLNLLFDKNIDLTFLLKKPLSFYFFSFSSIFTLE